MNVPASPVLLEFCVSECTLHWHISRLERNQRLQISTRKNRGRKKKKWRKAYARQTIIFSGKHFNCSFYFSKQQQQWSQAKNTATKKRPALKYVINTVANK